MNSDFLTRCGLNNIDIGIVILVMLICILALAIVLVVVLLSHFKLKKRYNVFCQGRDAKSLEDEISNLFKENAAIRKQTDKNKNDIRVLYRNFEKAFQKVGLVKYDAFPQMGGKLSFSLCLLNEKNSGFIINSVHGSDGSYTYSKEIKSGACSLTLGAEEQEALNIAMGGQEG